MRDQHSFNGQEDNDIFLIIISQVGNVLIFPEIYNFQIILVDDVDHIFIIDDGGIEPDDEKVLAILTELFLDFLQLAVLLGMKELY